MSANQYSLKYLSNKIQYWMFNLVGIAWLQRQGGSSPPTSVIPIIFSFLFQPNYIGLNWVFIWRTTLLKICTTNNKINKSVTIRYLARSRLQTAVIAHAVVSLALWHGSRTRHHLSVRGLAIFHNENGIHAPHRVAIKVTMHKPHT